MQLKCILHPFWSLCYLCFNSMSSDRDRFGSVHRSVVTEILPSAVFQTKDEQKVNCEQVMHTLISSSRPFKCSSQIFFTWFRIVVRWGILESLRSCWRSMKIWHRWGLSMTFNDYDRKFYPIHIIRILNWSQPLTQCARWNFIRWAWSELVPVSQLKLKTSKVASTECWCL